MATKKKKESTLNDAVAYFKDVIKRTSFEQFCCLDNVLISLSSKGVRALFIPELTLHNALSSDDEFKKSLTILTKEHPEYDDLVSKIQYGQRMNEMEWYPIDTEKLMSGQTIEIKVKGFEYPFPINKGLFPVRIRKTEFNNFSYSVQVVPDKIMMLRKIFDGPIPDTSFSILRVYRLI